MSHKIIRRNKEEPLPKRNEKVQEKQESNLAFQFVDKRSIAQKQKAMQKQADKSSKVRQLKRTQQLLNGAPANSFQLKKSQSTVPSKPVIQKMDSENKSEGIAARISRRNGFKKMTGRQKDLAIKKDKNFLSNPIKSNKSDRRDRIRDRLREKKARKLWDGSTRPGFTDETWDKMLGAAKSKERDDGVTVYQAEDGLFYPRKRDRVKKENYITLDHKVDWKNYILSNAAPELDGRISKISAREAYNDITNLELMSNSRNSSKSAPKGVFD